MRCAMCITLPVRCQSLSTSGISSGCPALAELAAWTSLGVCLRVHVRLQAPTRICQFAHSTGVCLRLHTCIRPQAMTALLMATDHQSVLACVLCAVLRSRVRRSRSYLRRVTCKPKSWRQV
jgi:hypothetical protein